MFDEVKFNPRPLKVEYCATFLNVAIDVNFVDVNVVDVNKIFKFEKKFYFAPLQKTVFVGTTCQITFLNFTKKL